MKTTTVPRRDKKGLSRREQKTTSARSQAILE